MQTRKALHCSINATNKNQITKKNENSVKAGMKLNDQQIQKWFVIGLRPANATQFNRPSTDACIQKNLVNRINMYER